MRNNFAAVFVLHILMHLTSQSLSLRGTNENSSKRNSLSELRSTSSPIYECLFLDPDLPICDEKLWVLTSISKFFPYFFFHFYFLLPLLIPGEIIICSSKVIYSVLLFFSNDMVKFIIYSEIEVYKSYISIYNMWRNFVWSFRMLKLAEEDWSSDQDNFGKNSGRRSTRNVDVSTTDVIVYTIEGCLPSK